MRAPTLTNRRKIIINLLGLGLAFLILSTTLIWKNNYKPDIEQIAGKGRAISQEELSLADGKNGHECLVAVSGIVYKIENSPLWQEGQHSTSMGQAYCGADLTGALKNSPHGSSKLEQLEKIGTLTN